MRASGGRLKLREVWGGWHIKWFRVVHRPRFQCRSHRQMEEVTVTVYLGRTNRIGLYSKQNQQIRTSRAVSYQGL